LAELVAKLEQFAGSSSRAGITGSRFGGLLAARCRTQLAVERSGKLREDLSPLVFQPAELPVLRNNADRAEAGQNQQTR
jgi:hypothetical protein